MKKIQSLNEHPPVAETLEAAKAATANRDQAKQELAQLEARADDVKRRRHMLSADELEETETLPDQIAQARKRADIAQQRFIEANGKLDTARRNAKLEILQSRHVQKRIENARSAVVKAARKLAEAQRDALDLQRELESAQLVQFDGPHGDVPLLGVLSGSAVTLQQSQAQLLAGIAHLERVNSGKAAA